MRPMANMIIIGAGVFGLTAALELAQRGHRVTVLEQDRIPSPLAASTDISKVCRFEYGTDVHYSELMEVARDRWVEWNERAHASGESPLYHETGVLMMSRVGLDGDGFERRSFETLTGLGQKVERISRDEIIRRFPAWRSGVHLEATFNPLGGWAASGRVIETLARRCREHGVAISKEVRVERVIVEAGKVTGVATLSGNHPADAVVLAAGAWAASGHWLASDPLIAHPPPIRSTGHAVFHIRPADPGLFAAEVFPVFGADLTRTGFYGFPLHPTEGVVKIALHDAGVARDPDGPRDVTERQLKRFEVFRREALPDLADAPIVATRLCLYADTPDEDFIIDGHPVIEHLFIAGGGSGHGFKFAPALGEIIADVVEDRPNRWRREFAWTPDAAARPTGPREGEASRFHEQV